MRTAFEKYKEELRNNALIALEEQVKTNPSAGFEAIYKNVAIEVTGSQDQYRFGSSDLSRSRLWIKELLFDEAAYDCIQNSRNKTEFYRAIERNQPDAADVAFAKAAFEGLRDDLREQWEECRERNAQEENSNKGRWLAAIQKRSAHARYELSRDEPFCFDSYQKEQIGLRAEMNIREAQHKFVQGVLDRMKREEGKHFFSILGSAADDATTPFHVDEDKVGIYHVMLKADEQERFVGEEIDGVSLPFDWFRSYCVSYYEDQGKMFGELAAWELVKHHVSMMSEAEFPSEKIMDDKSMKEVLNEVEENIDCLAQRWSNEEISSDLFREKVLKFFTRMQKEIVDRLGADIEAKQTEGLSL